jgi:hypothetical protein
MVSMRTSARGCRTGAVTGAKPMAAGDDTASIAKIINPKTCGGVLLFYVTE